MRCSQRVLKALNTLLIAVDFPNNQLANKCALSIYAESTELALDKAQREWQD